MRETVRVVGALSLALTAAAGPPQAHRALDESNRFAGHAGRHWPQDYDVLAGRCDTAAVLRVVGSTHGAATGTHQPQRIAVIVNTTIGAVIGATAGREIDRTDRGCIGHALELAPTGHVVTWTSTATRVAYTLTLVRNVDARCREFRLVGRRGGQEEITTQIACTDGDGRWRIR